MPVFALDDELIFPHPVLHEPDGLLAVGGDLSVEKLLLAYRWGIFPWYHEDQPILWWWIVPRLMLRPDEMKVSKSLRSIFNSKKFRVTFDTRFEEVMQQCGTIKRKGQDGTWITREMLSAYRDLHNAGHAHSVETWIGDELVGGLYGVSYGKIFSGESMFAKVPNASKVAFYFLAQHLLSKHFTWIDCQQDTPHMRSLGGHLIGEEEYLEILRENHVFVAQYGEKHFY